MKLHPTIPQSIAAGLMVLVLSSCAGKDKENEKLAEANVEQLYNEGLAGLEKNNYKSAAQAFEKIEQDQPYSKLAAQAQIMEAYAHYRNEKYDDAITVLDRFTKLHPGNKDIAYVYYLKALCYYEQISDVKRDQQTTVYALSALREVVARFPENVYARDAKIKIDLVNDHLAGKEMEIGRFYLRKGKAIAALNRFQEVVEKYQTTSHVPEALYRLTVVYLQLGIKEEALKNTAVLGYNYPSSKWYRYSYELFNAKSTVSAEKDTSWLKNLINKLRRI
jgi:outer membrane protein assembly factor BamD